MNRPMEWPASQGLFRGSVCKQEKGLESLRCSCQITAAGNADGIRGFGLFRLFERWSQIKPLTQKVEAVNDQYDYISWWLYDTDDYIVETKDGSQKWDLREPEALYNYLVEEN